MEGVSDIEAARRPRRVDSPRSLGLFGESRGARIATAALLAGLAILCLWLLIYETDRGARAIDFQSAIWNPLLRILDGESPYLSPDDPTVRAGTAAAYPPFVMLAFGPLAALPYAAAAALFMLLMAAASVGAVWAVGVRDPRCLAAVLVSLPVAGSVIWGSPTPLVVLCAGLAWRWRDHAWLAPLAVAVGVAVKFLIWPLVIWMAMTGRLRGALRTVALCAALVLVPWAVLGFDGLVDYPELLRLLGQAGDEDGLLVHAAASRLGAPSDVATAVGLLAAAGLLGLAWFVRSDRGRFALAVLAGIVSSPLAWIYYLAVFGVVIGLWARRWSPPWLFVVALWAVGVSLHPHSAAANAYALALTGVLVAWVLRSSRDEAGEPDSQRSPATMGAAADPA